MKTEIKNKKETGYSVIDYLRFKHPEAEGTVKIESNGSFEQASILVGHVFVSQRTPIFQGRFDSVLFKDRNDTNKRFTCKIDNGYNGYKTDMTNEKSLRDALTSEILNVIEVFGL